MAHIIEKQNAHTVFPRIVRTPRIPFNTARPRIERDYNLRSTTTMYIENIS